MSNEIKKAALAAAAVITSTVGSTLGAVSQTPLSPADAIASTVEATLSKKENESEKTPIPKNDTAGS